MNRLYSVTLLFGLLASAVCAEPLLVRLQTVDKRQFSGTLVKRENGAVIFQPTGAPAMARIQDDQIANIQYRLEDGAEENMNRLFKDGQYTEANAEFDKALSPLLEYAALPSNLTPLFVNWMAASFWTGEYDRALALADALKQGGSGEIAAAALFYGGLARMEKGDFQTLETFLKTSGADSVYPPGSPARLYIEARRLQRNKEFVPAIRTAALIIVRHSRDVDWMPMAELLCAELYAQLDMPDSKNAELANINEFYSSPWIRKKAAAIAAMN